MPDVVTSMKVIDQTRPDHDMCGSLTLSKANVARYFQLADAVDASAFHAEAIILPCRFQGTIRVDGHLYHWEIFAGGAGYLYDGKAFEQRYLCREKCLDALPNLR